MFLLGFLYAPALRRVHSGVHGQPGALNSWLVIQSPPQTVLIYIPNLFLGRTQLVHALIFQTA